MWRDTVTDGGAIAGDKQLYVNHFDIATGAWLWTHKRRDYIVYVFNDQDIIFHNAYVAEEW